MTPDPNGAAGYPRAASRARDGEMTHDADESLN